MNLLGWRILMLSIAFIKCKIYKNIFIITLIYLYGYLIIGCGIIKSMDNYTSENKFNHSSTSMNILSASKLVHDYPKSGRAHFMLGVAYYHKHQYNKAIDELNISKALQQNEACYYYLGYSYESINDYDNAIKSFNMLINIYKQNLGSTYEELGIAEFNKGDITQSRKYYKIGLAYNPHNGNAYYSLGIFAAYKNKLTFAENYFKKAIIFANSDPEVGRDYSALGKLYEQEKRYNKAISSYKKALSADPGNDNAKKGLLRLKI